MKPYSKDFRTKIIETKQKTNESVQQIANRFQVSYSFVYRLLKRYEVTVSVEPKPHGGGKPPLLNSQQIDILRQLVEEDNDATIKQLSIRLTEKTGIKVSIPTICRLLQRLELTRKKKTGGRASPAPLFMLMKLHLYECKNSEANIGQLLEKFVLKIWFLSMKLGLIWL